MTPDLVALLVARRQRSGNWLSGPPHFSDNRQIPFQSTGGGAPRRSLGIRRLLDIISGKKLFDVGDGDGHAGGDHSFVFGQRNE
jgi:hypothetical protein